MTTSPMTTSPMTNMPSTYAPSTRQTVALIAIREITVRLRDKAFLISTGVLIALVGGSVAIPLFLFQDKPEFTLAAVGPQATATANLARTTGQQAITLADRQQDERDAGTPFQPGTAVRTGESAAPPATITVRTVPDLAAAQALVRDGTADGALVAQGTGGTGLTLIGDTDMDSDLARLVTLAVTGDQVSTALRQAGLSVAQIQGLDNVTPQQIRLLDPPGANQDIAIGLGFAFSVLFFLTSFTYGLLIAQSVVEEKQSRVVELLVSAVPVRLILAGKVLGTTALALGQVVLLLGVALAAASAAGTPAVVSLLLHSGGWFLLFFVLGFTMLSCLWAAAGAICARQEDLQGVTAPLQVLIMIPFLISTNISEEGTWMTVMSYIPFSSPLMMPRRLLIGDAAWWEPVLAAAGILATGAILVLIAARIYENSLLRTGSKTSLRAAWRGTQSELETNA